MAKWFRTRLREARDARGITQAEAGDQLGVSATTISFWENGQAEPRGETRERVEEWLKKPTSRRQSSGKRGAKADSEPADAARRTRQARREEEEDDSEDEEESFSEWLHSERKKADLSRKDLAERAGISAQSIYLIETGRVGNPWKQTRERLINALGSGRPPTEVEAEIAEETEIAGLGSFNDFGPWDESTIQEVGCVYVYYDRTDRPVYVGETVNLRRRNVQHQENDRWFIRRIVDRGSYVVTSSTEQRKQLEKLLLQFLRRNTLFNRKDTQRSVE